MPAALVAAEVAALVAEEAPEVVPEPVVAGAVVAELVSLLLPPVRQESLAEERSVLVLSSTCFQTLTTGLNGHRCGLGVGTGAVTNGDTKAGT